MVQKSPGVIFAQSLFGYAVVGFFALIGTRADVEIEPFGSLPSGWAEFAGHFGVRTLPRRSRVRASNDADVARVVGAAKAVTNNVDSTVKVFMVRVQLFKGAVCGVGRTMRAFGMVMTDECNGRYLYTR